MVMRSIGLCLFILASEGNSARLKPALSVEERDSKAHALVTEWQADSLDSGSEIPRQIMAGVTDVLQYGLIGEVRNDLNLLPQKDGVLHFSFATQLGTELGYAFPVMIMLVKKGHDVTLCARTFNSPHHSITPGLSKGLVEKLTRAGVKVVEPPHEKYADVNEWWTSNYEYKVDLFVEDLLTIDVAKPPTMMVAEATESPLSLWSGNTWLLWNRIQKGLFPPPLPNVLYPSFVASWHGVWDPPPAFKAEGLEELDFADPDGESRWRVHKGAKVAFVRKSVAAVGAIMPNEEIELQKIAAAIAQKPDKKLVLFVLGTQGSQLSFEGYRKTLEDLSKFDATFVIVLVKPTDWTGDWANTIDPAKNQEIIAAWKQWYTNGGNSQSRFNDLKDAWKKWSLEGGNFTQIFKKQNSTTYDLPANFVFTTYVPQAQLLSKYGDRTIMISGMGASSLAEAIDAEVPILGFPVQADQPENSRMVQDLQVGVNRSAFVTELYTTGDVQKPYGGYGKVWRKLVGEQHVTNDQLEGFGIDLSAALEHVSSNWDRYKENIRKLKDDLAKLTFSQEEVADLYIAMLPKSRSTKIDLENTE